MRRGVRKVQRIPSTCPAQNAPISVLRSVRGIRSSLFPGKVSMARNATVDSIPTMISPKTIGCLQGSEACRSTAAKSDDVAMTRVTAPGISKARCVDLSSFSYSCSWSSSGTRSGYITLVPTAISKPQAIAMGTCPRNSLQRC